MTPWNNLRRALRAARWAFSNADGLALLRHHLYVEACERNIHGRATKKAQHCSRLLNSYLSDLPIERTP